MWMNSAISLSHTVSQIPYTIMPVLSKNLCKNFRRHAITSMERSGRGDGSPSRFGAAQSSGKGEQTGLFRGKSGFLEEQHGTSLGVGFFVYKETIMNTNIYRKKQEVLKTSLEMELLASGGAVAGAICVRILNPVSRGKRMRVSNVRMVMMQASHEIPITRFSKGFRLAGNSPGLTIRGHQKKFC